ncbi:hypothetical protein [Mycobacterium sp. 852002-51961_SCH5331710]|uniref:hypothetical protein n=1 Tax=Mycobacterium sp. 852002-51961_SCH5331710 TaxID=1834105 RepID=UPI000B29FA1B|nr:hypothetical protein [Mycobacterium sp. 852002-51961_SCH5331710]
MRIVINPKRLSLLGAGMAAALMAAAPQTLADPAAPAPPPPPPAPPASAAVTAAAAPAPAPAPAPADPVAVLRPASAAPPPAPPPEPAAAPAPTEPEGVSHLASPDTLPPGTTLDPTGRGNESPNISYLKDLWHAVQSQEISGKEALIMGLAQRGMNTPIPDQVPGPNVPNAPTAPAPQAPAPPAPLAPAPPAPPAPTP